jgi:NAD(P)-dependent dehydrogenase (short-subunit alcohol dehydrogenase family)
MTGRLQDKACIITGAARGIGLAAAERFLDEGARVAILDLDRERGEAAAARLDITGRCSFFPVDLTRANEVQSAVGSAAESLGGVDVLVNNAGYYPLQKWSSITLADWERVISINLTSVFLMCKACEPHLVRSKGKIVNLCSATVFSGGLDLAHYISAKGGILAFTRALAKELGQYEITVNALAPGLTLTETVLEDRPIEDVDINAAGRALRRRELPEDLTGTLLFLASSDSDFMTGQTLVVDGGRALH